MVTPIEVEVTGSKLALTLSTDKDSHSFYSERPVMWLELVTHIRAVARKHLHESHNEGRQE